jgi:hypothetical protein
MLDTDTSRLRLKALIELSWHSPFLYHNNIIYKVYIRLYHSTDVSYEFREAVFTASREKGPEHPRPDETRMSILASCCFIIGSRAERQAYMHSIIEDVYYDAKKFHSNNIL